MSQCPCASGKTLESCCGPILGGAPAPSPEAAMRARYAAYVLCDIDHLDRSLTPESRADHDKKQAEQWAKSVEWLGLDILATSGGGQDDSEGMVEFSARFRQNGIEQTHHETSIFQRDGQGWLYANGKVHAEPVRRAGPKVGRNDPCPCGSGKKYKQCCGR